jgi:hypothetical protein
LEVCRATLGCTGDDQRPPTRAKQARRRLTRRIVVVIVMGRDIMGQKASVKEGKANNGHDHNAYHQA